MDCFVQSYTSFALALYIIDASCSGFVSGLGQDGQSLLFGENTVQGCTLSLVACEETTLLCVTLHWSHK